MKREYHNWWSAHLHRNMELLVFGHAGAKVLIFPTRDGRFYEYENLGLVDILKSKIEQGWLQLYCVDCVYQESFYDSLRHPSERVQRQLAYEQYILNDVLPFMQSKNDHSCVIAHGLSLGAFHAASIAFRFPHLFKKLVAFSGRYDLTLEVECFRNLLDNFYNDDVYFLTPNHFLPNLECQWRLSHLRSMDIVLVIGQEDPFINNNRYLGSILSDKQIPHNLVIWNDRAHSAPYWRNMANLFI